MNKFILYLVAPLTICYSCDKIETEEADNPAGGKTNVEFFTTITGLPFDSGNGGYTRAYEDVWEQGDQVGIYMYDAQTGLANSTIADNKKYTANAAGNLYTDNQNKIMIEEGDPQVDFVAYYPYQEQVENFLYSINITDQQDQSGLDFLFARTTVGYTTQNLPVNLVFDHRMTKLVFNVTSDAAITNFRAVLKGAVYEADFSLVDGSYISGVSGNDITLKSTVNGNTVTVEGIVFPEGAFAVGKEIMFTINGKQAVWPVPSGTEWNPGVKLKYKVNITAGGTEVKENYGWFETPVKTNIDNTVFLTYDLPEPDRAKEMRNYSMLYDTRYKVAYWVAYPMCQYYREGSSSSTNYTDTYWFYDNFAAHSLSENQQPDAITAWPNPQEGVYYDRGHQIPSADRRYSLEVNKSTYYVTNQTAQQKDMNQGIWAGLEGRVRTWMNQCDTIYVVTGAHLTTETDQNIGYVLDNSGKQVALPKYYYKALAKVSFGANDEITSCHTAAYAIENANVSGTYHDYRMTVSQLEEMTGFTFFPALPDEVKNTLTPTQWQ